MRLCVLLSALWALSFQTNESFYGFPSVESNGTSAALWPKQSAFLTPPRSSGILSGSMPQCEFVLGNFDPTGLTTYFDALNTLEHVSSAFDVIFNVTVDFSVTFPEEIVPGSISHNEFVLGNFDPTGLTTYLGALNTFEHVSSAFDVISSATVDFSVTFPGLRSIMMTYLLVGQ